MAGGRLVLGWYGSPRGLCYISHAGCRCAPCQGAVEASVNNEKA